MRVGVAIMPQMTVSERGAMVDRLRGRVPVNKQTALIVGKATGWWNQDKSRDPLDFISGRQQVFECPKLLALVPAEYRSYIGRRVGSVDVVGVVPDWEKRRLGWRNGSLVVRCLCGRFENRTTSDIRKPSRKEYVDDCTVQKRLG